MHQAVVGWAKARNRHFGLDTVSRAFAHRTDAAIFSLSPQAGRGQRRRAFVLVAFTAVASWLAAVGPGMAQERLAIVTTTSDLRSLTEAVGGDRVAVTSLVPPSFDPEDYQPRPQDLARLKRARLVVRVGLDFDLWFDRLIAQAGLRRGEAGYADASFAIAALEVRGASIGPGDGH